MPQRAKKPRAVARRLPTSNSIIFHIFCRVLSISTEGECSQNIIDERHECRRLESRNVHLPLLSKRSPGFLQTRVSASRTCRKIGKRIFQFPLTVAQIYRSSTVLVLRMAHRKWKETKQKPSMLSGPAVPGCCLIFFHILWVILSTSTVHF